MNEAKTYRRLLAFSLVGFGVMSASILIMPIRIFGILPGILFWCGMLVGIGPQIILEMRRRAFFASYGVSSKNMQKPRNGLFSFRSNKPAQIADYIFLLSIPLTVLAFVTTKGVGYICYVFITVTLYAFCLHCIFNGRIFFHAQNQQKIRRVLEERKSKKKEGEGTI